DRSRRAGCAVLLYARCLSAVVAVFTRTARASGMLWRASGGRRWASRLPAICETRGTPYLSRRIWPMMLGGFPSLESFRTRASISSGSYLNQEGGRLLTGRVEPELPLFPEYSLSIYHYFQL